jgi:hypothetical protein
MPESYIKFVNQSFRNNPIQKEVERRKVIELDESEVIITDDPDGDGSEGYG